MNCPVCLSSATVAQTFTGSDLLFETTSRTFNFRGCTGCRCIFVDPIPDEEELAGFYPTRYWWSSSSSSLLKSLEGVYRRAILHDHVAFILRAAKELLPERRPVRLLDVGCGSGTLLTLLKRRGFHVRGFDASKEAAAVAKGSDIEVITGRRLQEAHFETGAFDLVTLFHVMEHVRDPRDLLAEVRRLLLPGGRIVLQVPNVESWQFRLCGVRWYGLDVPRHVINYSHQSIRHLLLDSGFRVLRTRQFNLRDNAPALASSLFPYLDPVSRSVRRQRGNGAERASAAWAKHAFYLSAVAAAYPFAIIESLAGAGATVMIEAENI